MTGETEKALMDAVKNLEGKFDSEVRSLRADIGSLVSSLANAVDVMQGLVSTVTDNRIERAINDFRREIKAYIDNAAAEKKVIDDHERRMHGKVA